MATYLTKEKKADIFSEYGGSAANSGSIEGQIALFTYRINSLSDHLRSNKKDHSCRQSLLYLRTNESIAALVLPKTLLSRQVLRLLL